MSIAESEICSKVRDIAVGSNKEYTFYDIYGFVLAVDDFANEWFRKEYRRFEERGSSVNRNVDLYVCGIENELTLPTKPWGGNKGLLLPFGKNGRGIVLYNKGLESNFIQRMVQPLVRWNDKCFIHAGGVSKEERAILLAGESNIGKTELVFGLLERGFAFLGDDTLVVGHRRVYPFPVLVHVLSYHFVDNRKIAKATLGRMGFAYMLPKIYFRTLHFLRKRFPERRVRWLLDRRTSLGFFDIQQLFPNIKISEAAHISGLLLLESSQKKEIQTDDASPYEFARRMSYQNMAERSELINEYWHYASAGMTDDRFEEMFQNDYEIILETVLKTKILKVQIPKSKKISSIREPLLDIAESIF